MSDYPIVNRTVVLVGLMGAGKSTVGRRLAERLRLPFIDSDDEIVKAADLTISEIFERFGEQYFRDGERKVISRLLDGPPCILATGGGAFLSDENRTVISASGVSVWIAAELETLWDRVRDKPGRPLLQGDDPKRVLSDLLEARYPVYGLADIVVESAKGQPHNAVVDAIIAGLDAAGYLDQNEIVEGEK